MDFREETQTHTRTHTHTGPGDGRFYYLTQPVAKLAPQYMDTHAAEWRSLVPLTTATRNDSVGIKPYLAAWIGA